MINSNAMECKQTEQWFCIREQRIWVFFRMKRNKAERKDLQIKGGIELAKTECDK